MCVLNYIGDTFQAQEEIQDAVIAYEAALEALESEGTLKLESVIDRLSQVSQGFYITSILQLRAPILGKLLQ